MPGARDIKARIKGVKSTGKITRAMEMISAVKMRKAAHSVQAIRPYAEAALHVLGQLEHAIGRESHPLLVERTIVRELYVVITSNRGLCGAFNAQIMKRLRQALEEDKEREAVFITVGKKGENSLRRMGGNIIASFPDVLAAPDALSMRPITRIIMEEFMMERVDRVVMVYTDYVSVMVQDVKLRALLPVRLKDSERTLNEIPGDTMAKSDQAEYIIEPSAESVLTTMIPKLIEMELYHALLESNASQEAARMLAMRNATDAAKEMAEDYTLMYNQLRQQKITQEIAELSAGMAAVS
ncbi:MAG: ATP synthase F1 subunit gamma [Patescibacteria group bacterium]